MSSKTMKRVLDELGRYYGLRSSDAFLNAITDPNAGPQKWDSPVVTGGPKSATEIINMIAGVSDKHPSIFQLAAACEQAFKGDPDLTKTANALFCITPSRPDAPGAGSEFVPWNRPTVQLPEGEDKSQGIMKPVTGDMYTTSDYSRVVDAPGGTEQDTGEVIPVNVIQVFPAVGNLANNDTDVVALFMNSIPTMELSRAIPYIP